MSLIRITTLLLGSLLASACATPHVTSGVETRAFLTGECLVTGRKAVKESTGIEVLLVGLAADIAGKAVGASIDSISRQLKDEKSASLESVERTPPLFYGDKASVSLRPEVGCVVAIVGRFDSSRSSDEAVANFVSQLHLNDTAAKKTESRLLNTSARGKAIIQRLGKVYVYAEYGLDFTDNVENISYTTQKYVVNDFAGEGFGVASSTRDLRLAIEITTPSGAAIISMSSDKLSLEKESLPFISNEVNNGPWQVVDPKIRVVSSDDRGTKVFLPANIKVQYFETGKPGQLSKIVGEALSNQQAAIVTHAQNQAKYFLSSEEKQAAQVIKTNVASTRLTEYQTAYDTAKKTSDELKSLDKNDPTRPGKLSSFEAQLSLVESRKDLAKLAFREAGLSFTANPPIERP